MIDFYYLLVYYIDNIEVVKYIKSNKKY